MAIIPEKYTTLSSLQEEYQKFWNHFNPLSLNHSDFSSRFKVHPIASIRCYQDYSVGESYILTLKINFAKNLFYVSAYFNSATRFAEYHEKYKTRIETDLGYELEWKQHATAGYAKKGFAVDLFDKSQYDKICNRMMEEGIRLISVFKKYSK